MKRAVLDFRDFRAACQDEPEGGEAKADPTGTRWHQMAQAMLSLIDFAALIAYFFRKCILVVPAPVTSSIPSAQGVIFKTQLQFNEELEPVQLHTCSAFELNESKARFAGQR